MTRSLTDILIELALDWLTGRSQMTLPKYTGLEPLARAWAIWVHRGPKTLRHPGALGSMHASANQCQGPAPSQVCVGQSQRSHLGVRGSHPPTHWRRVTNNRLARPEAHITG